MTDIRKQVNQRPFVPSSTHDYGKLANATTATNTSRVQPTSVADSLPSLDDIAKKRKAAEAGDEKAKEEVAQVEGKARDVVSGEINEALYEILDGDKGFLPNSLSAHYTPTYHFKLFMTIEQELVTSAKTQSEMVKALDAMPKVVIAESGVTAGFNITSVDIEQSTGPGFRTRSAMMSGMDITIVEPLGTSLVEQIITAGAELGVQNFAKFWYFLELSFLGYDENGGIVNDPLADMELSNGGRWIYQIAFTDMKMHVDESGATYNIRALPYSSAGFDDDGCGRVPDNMQVSGKTIKEFCDSLAAKLTRAWGQRYAGEIYTFKIVNMPVLDDKNQKVDIGSMAINQTDKDPIRNIQFQEEGGGGANLPPVAQIPRGSAIADVLTFLYAHVEGAQKIMLDTTSPENLDDGEDDAVNWNGKKYRVAMVPYIEPDVKVVGFDPVTGNYMKEITYVIWGYRTYGSNLSPSQFEMVKKNPNLAVDIVNDLMSKKYLQKRYHYLYTGQNTEVSRFDIDFNFAFSALLPALTGWRQNIDSVSVHEKLNPATRDAGGSQTTQKNEAAMSPDKLFEKLSKINTELDSAEDDLTQAKDREDTDKIKEAQDRINNLRQQQQTLQGPAAQLRSEARILSQANQDRIKREGVKNLYAEDAAPVPVALPISYSQGANEAQTAAGVGFFNQWHRGSSLTGALLNQVYSPIPSTMASITLDIKGDPYWLGMAGLERRNVVQNPATQPSRPDNRPSFVDGDNTFAIIFRFPKTLTADGEPVFRTDDMFNGVYRCANVKSSFKEGQFTQTLTGIKLELITLARPKSNGNTGINN
jgi:hypothetical protein